MATTPVVPSDPNVIEGSVTKKVLDITNLQKVEKTAPYKFEKFTSVDQVAALPPAELLELVNDAKHSEARRAAKATIEGPDISVLANFVAGMKFSPRFKLDSNGSVTTDDSKVDKAKQKQAIYSAILSNEGIMAVLKDSVSVASTTGDDDEDSPE